MVQYCTKGGKRSRAEHGGVEWEYDERKGRLAPCLPLPCLIVSAIFQAFKATFLLGTRFIDLNLF